MAHTTINKYLIFIFIIPLVAFGQSTKFPTKADLTKVYEQAIADFIKEAYKKSNTKFDTLFLLKRVNREPDDFPNIELPGKIENTQIRQVIYSFDEKKLDKYKTRIYINLIGWVDKEKSEFIFIVFSNGFEHQYDYQINYKYNHKRKEFELTKLQFKGPPFDK